MKISIMPLHLGFNPFSLIALSSYAAKLSVDLFVVKFQF